MKTAAELAALVNGRLEGDGSIALEGVAGLEEATANQLSFFGNNRYKSQLAATKARVVLVPGDAPPRGDRTWIVVPVPHLAFARIGQAFHPSKRYAPSISPRAAIDPSAQVDPSATVMDHVTVGPHATIGPRAVLSPGVYVGAHARIGADSVLGPNASVLDHCEVGARCLFHPGVVIGADGFGFAVDLSVPEHVKIPQVGIVRVEDDVEIGANSCVDRATTGVTVIGRGSKIDNLVQVGHNCTVGPLSILCAQVGLAGSTSLGMGVTMGGQAASAGHLHIGDLARLGGKSAVMSDVEPNAVVLGAPAFDAKDFMRSWAVVQRLPDLQRELRDLRKRLEALEKEKTSP